MKTYKQCDPDICDWCNKLSTTLISHRDLDEGFFGPEYMVCAGCRRKESDQAERELEDMGFDDDWYCG